MNTRDKELAQQAWTENDWDGYVDIPKLVQLVRADEREACAKVCDAEGEYSNPYAVGLAARAIRARENI